LNLFSFLNSQNYYTVYPTIVQVIDAISVFIGRTVFGSMVIMKLIFLGFELLSFYFLRLLLKDYKKEEYHVFWYWLCPLVLLEFVGNLHHECLMITFVLGAIWYLKSKQILLSGLFLSLAIFTKLTPLLFIPFFVLSIALKDNFRFIGILIVSSVVMILPIIYNDGYLYFLKSINLYFSSFEFNSSFYQLVFFAKKYFGDFRIEYKAAVIFIMFFCIWKWWSKKLDMVLGIAVVYSIYVFTAQSVHPWYLLPLLPIFLLRNVPKYYLVWLLLIPLTYITYIDTTYQQRIWVSILEYGIVGCLLVIHIFIGKNSSLKGESY